MSLYADYLKEHRGEEIIENEHGFVTYKQIDKETYYIVDVYVKKESRKLGLATQLAKEVENIAIKNGVNKILGSIDLTTNLVTESMFVLISNGYKYSHANGNGIYFIKKIGG